MAVAFCDLGSASGLKKLDEYLLTRSYVTGYQASKDDITVHAALPKPPSSEFVNVSRWFNHIEALPRIPGDSAEGCGVLVEGFAAITEEAVATPPAGDTKALSRWRWCSRSGSTRRRRSDTSRLSAGRRSCRCDCGFFCFF